jgi:ABC-type transporter Mla subunit MlaD
MKKQTKPALIGVFVVGAIALAIGAVIVFGSGRFFTERYKYVAFFEGSVFGLSQGAPVICKGVRVGTVTGIELLGDPEKFTMQIAVFFETEPKRVRSLGKRQAFDSRKMMKTLIQHGLRAHLEMQSFLTRQMMVVLDFRPETPVRLVGIDTGYPEIPTIRSPMQELLETVERLPIEEIANSIRNALEGIEQVIHSPEVAESLAALKGTLVATERLVNHADKQLDPLVQSLEGTLRDTRSLVKNLDAQVDPLVSNMGQTLEAARLAIVEAQGAIASIESNTREDSPLVYQLTVALAELSAASRSLRLLAEYLEQHPEALLRGKDGSGGK